MRRATPRSTLVLVCLLGIVSGAAGQSDSELFRSTLVQDIATAPFYELIGWLESVGLSTRGDRSALAERLYDFYAVTDAELDRHTAAQPSASTDNPPLVIDSASRTRYFTLEEIDERYVRLSGGVLVTLRDDEQGAVHRIEADEVTYNEDQQTLAASGSVIYTLERGDTVERFTGEALTVELDTWEGAFVQGVTERARTIEGEEIDFAFSGTYITRSIDDVIVLDDGRITSSQAVPPNYEIRANKIWVLAPGEWGLRNAYLYVGRVPIFYVPFFFKPGNELFFNPAIGTRDRSGTFIQTTTYLIGAPEEQTSAFSLLQLAEEAGEQADRRIEGLYLVPSEESHRTEPSTPSGSGSTMRVLADVYTKLGACEQAHLHDRLSGSRLGVHPVSVRGRRSRSVVEHVADRIAHDSIPLRARSIGAHRRRTADGQCSVRVVQRPTLSQRFRGTQREHRLARSPRSGQSHGDTPGRLFAPVAD